MGVHLRYLAAATKPAKYRMVTSANRRSMVKTTIWFDWLKNEQSQQIYNLTLGKIRSEKDTDSVQNLVNMITGVLSTWILMYNW